MRKLRAKLTFLTFILGYSSAMAFEKSPFFVEPSTSENPDCSLKKGTLPYPERAAGKTDPGIPLEHILVLIQENHSFDNYFGQLNQNQFYGNEVDGLQSTFGNQDRTGQDISIFHQEHLCTLDPKHDWNSMHQDWNQGLNNQFVTTNNNPQVMGYYDQNDLAFYYSLANQFAIADRYFAPTMTQTFPNRFFSLAATAFGHIKNDIPLMGIDYKQPTIFDTLNKYHISWKYYSDGPGILMLFSSLLLHSKSKMAPVTEFQSDLNHGRLPQVVFIDSKTDGENEHPDGSIQLGEQFVYKRVKDLASSPYWKSSVLFLTYDEGGGFYDHVPPPAACKPDDIEPNLKKPDVPGHYDRYGFRVPFVAVSPFSKHHYVSHQIYDHTSILKFIETKYNLPALTNRDANANNLLDLFDFDHPRQEVLFPELAPAADCATPKSQDF